MRITITIFTFHKGTIQNLFHIFDFFKNMNKLIQTIPGKSMKIFFVIIKDDGVKLLYVFIWLQIHA